MEKQTPIIYNHINKDIPSQAADGAYCLSGRNGNIFINFFQEIPDIPKSITFYEDVREPEEIRMENPLEKHNTPYWETGEGGIQRVFVGKMQLSPDSAKLLAKNILATLADMEK